MFISISSEASLRNVLERHATGLFIEISMLTSC